MSAEPQRTCPICGNELSGAMEFCPVCMLRKGLAGGFESRESSVSEDTVKPTAERAAQRFEHYELVTGEDGKPVELGRGAMGVTYKAFDVDLRLPVTLKLISERYIGDQSSVLRFLREARAAAKVRHSNVASVFHLGTTGQNYFYAMEFVEGETLENLIKRSGRLEVKLALEIATQVASGLTAVHKQKLVHRDIKPSNIMVSVEEESIVTAKIIDLGLAKPAPDAPAEDAISIPGAFAGTPEFASPEQFAGIGVDIRSDLYSLGVTLWEMLTGKTPFRGTPGEVMHQHQHAPLPLEQLEDVPQPVVVLLEVLLEKDPAQRFQNPTDLLKVVPVVMEAVEARRSIKRRNLRTAFVQQLSSKPKKLPSIRLPKRSIAVLPFDTLSHAKGNTYFADGVQDEILSNLAKLSQLKVISRTSVMTFRPGANRNLRSIAQSLGVTKVVEGTVRRDGKRVRLTIRLVNARTDETLWSESYDRDLTDIFAIQSEIAQTVASKLRSQLSPQERQGIEEKPTNDLESYDLYLQAKQLIPHGNSMLVQWVAEREHLPKAVRLLEEATQRDPKFALAYCLMAKAHDFLYFDQLDHTQERRALGDAAVNEALRIRPDLPEVHLAAAFHLYRCYRDFERARVQIAIAAQTLPSNPELLELAAMIDWRQGQWERCIAGLERAASLDPRNTELLELLAEDYFSLRRYRDSERIRDRQIALQPDQPLFRIMKGDTAFAEKADVKGARALYEALPLPVKNDIWITMQRALYAMCDHDWRVAKEIVNNSPNEEIGFSGAVVPRRVADIWLEFVRGNHPTMEEFGARELNDTNALALALNWAANLAYHARNPAEVDRLASEMIGLSTRHNFVYFLTVGTIHRGWGRSVSGDTPEGMSWIEHGIRDLRATGTVLGLPAHLARKAEALHLADRSSEALEVINEAEALAERFEQPYFCAELHRLRGVFLTAIGADESQIEASFREAIRIARGQKSISLEKRAEATYAEYRRQKASGSGGRGSQRL
jgi:serine/threonine protein kinase/Flp pilus assembly protein TadD